LKTSLRASAGRTPEEAEVANERLRSALASAGRTYDALAGIVGVDPKTVERWVLSDRLPHRTHRQAAAQALGRDESYLWPALLSEHHTQAASEAEVLRVYPTRGAVPQDQWISLIKGATEELGFLSYSSLFLLDSNPEIAELLAERAKSGVQVRILLGDPRSDVIRQRGTEEGIGEGLSGRVRVAQAYLSPALGVPGIEVRLHATTLYNSIYRSDGTMLVNMHMYGSGAPANPVMHVQRVDGGRLFEKYLSSFERVWDVAMPVDVFE
jgi:transcriptional regulator with XRE-family HTH domain